METNTCYSPTRRANGSRGVRKTVEARCSARSLVGIRWSALVVVLLLGLFFASGSFAAVTDARITASPTEIAEGEESVFTLTLTADETETSAYVVVDVGGSATLGMDYAIEGYPDNSQKIGLKFGAWEAGTSERAIRVRALNDSIPSEKLEDIVFTISNCTGYEPPPPPPPSPPSTPPCDDDYCGNDVPILNQQSGTPISSSCPVSVSSATVSIVDITPKPITATIEATDPRASSDGSDPGELTVRLSAPAPSDGVRVNYSVGGTAAAGTDYHAIPGVVPFSAGQRSATIPVRPIATFSPDDKTVVVTLDGGLDYEVGDPSSATVTIFGVSPPTATIEATDPSASSDGSGPGKLTVRLSVPARSDGLRVNLSVGGTAVSGTDYEGLPDSVSFNKGESSVSIPVQPIATFSPDDKTVVVTLNDGPDYEVGDPSSATVTIFGVSVPNKPTVSIETTRDASKDGPEAGRFTIRLSEPAPEPIQVAYRVGGTAVSGQDYSPLPGSELIPAKETTATIVIDPIPGGSIGDTAVVLTLVPGSGYRVSKPSSAEVNIAQGSVGIAIESGGNQAAAPGLSLDPFVVKVTSGGVPVAGVAVLWTIERGEGTLSSQRSVTDSNGLASSTLTPSSDGEIVVKAQVEDGGDSVEFTTLFNPLVGLPGLTPNQRAIAATLDALCPRLDAIGKERALSAGEQDLLTQCKVLQQSSVTDPGAASQGVAALTPDQASAPRKMATQLTGAQLTNIEARLSNLRQGARGISLSNLTLNVDGQSINGGALAGLLKQLGETGGGASADDAGFERLGVFVNGNIDWGDKDPTDNEEGFDFQTLGITAGVDYRFVEGLVLGMALGYGSSDVDIDSNGGDLNVDAWSSLLYGTYYATDHFYLEGSATYAWGDYEQSRNISYDLLGGSRTANADYDGTQYAFMFGAGYDFLRGEGIFDVYGNLRYLKADIDGYRESGASGLDLDIGSQEATSFSSTLGVNYTRAISTAKAILIPQAWLEWTHEFDSGDDDVTGVFANDPSFIPFALATDKLDRDYFRLGFGVGAQFGKGRTAFFNYEAAIGLTNYTEQTANLGVRLEF
jgi:outer membrane autotransporter protein